MKSDGNVQVLLAPGATMERTFIDLREEASALRRVSVLLERLREDVGARNSDLEELQAGVDSMRRAAAAARTIHPSAIDRMATVLRRISASADARDGSVCQLVRSNALLETRELLDRLAHRREW